MNKLILAAVGSVLAAAVPAGAQAPVPPRAQDRLGEPRFPGLGRDNVQSRATLHRDVQSLFARLDRNRDGFIARDEAQAGRQRIAGEPRAARRAMRRATSSIAPFDRIDTDRNGVISRDEFARHTAMRQHRQALRGARGGKGFASLRGRMFDAADANRDNRVSIQEATAAAFQRFDRSDLNRDGLLTREERRRSRQLLRSQRQRG